MTTPAVTVTARRGSRWRCGVEFTGRPASYPAGHWTEDELERLRADPQLVVADGAAADGHPTTPTVDAALDAALSALRQATPGRVGEFLEAMERDPEIRGKIEDAIVARAGAAPDATRPQKILAAVGGLAPENPDHWNADGKTPSIKALEAATGFTDISAAERDAAHEAWAEGKDLTGG